MKKMEKQQIWGSLGLLIATILWGFSFVVIKDSTESIPVIYLLALRYLIASAGMTVFLFCRKVIMVGLDRFKYKGYPNCKRYSNYIPDNLNHILYYIKQGMVLGGLLFVSQFFQTLGCKYTTAGKNAFITTIYVILVPFIYWWTEKRRPDRKCIAAAFIAVLGIGLLSIQGNLTVQIGDFLTVICGAGLALHIIFVDKYTRNSDPVVLTTLQFFFANLISWLCVLAGRIPFPLQVFEPNMAGKMLYLGIFSTMVGFLLQIVCQKRTNPNVASVLLTTEAVFGMLFSVLLLHERFTVRMFAGCICLFAAVLISELKKQ